LRVPVRERSTRVRPVAGDPLHSAHNDAVDSVREELPFEERLRDFFDELVLFII